MGLKIQLHSYLIRGNVLPWELLFSASLLCFGAS